MPVNHPPRKIRRVVNDGLAGLDAEFETLYIVFGRPSIAPERLIRASLIQILFSVRSERKLLCGESQVAFLITLMTMIMNAPTELRVGLDISR